MKTAILFTLLVFGIAFVMSMLVALLIKGLYRALRHFTAKS
ncbi:MAG: hypothetical protein QM790_11690 [Nibricoccus sp.]